MRDRHRVSKLLLRQGIVYYGGAAWTGKHQVWLRTHRFDAAGLQVAYDSAVEAMGLTTDRRDAAITVMAADSEFTAVTDRVCSPARDLHLDRVRASRGGRGLAPVHRVHDLRCSWCVWSTDFRPFGLGLSAGLVAGFRPFQR
jgi:hypothetical protein